MRSVRTCVLTAGLVVLAASSGFAQPRPSGPGGVFSMAPMPNALMVLRDEQAQAELKLTTDQKAAFLKVRDRYKDEFDKARESQDYKTISELLQKTGDEIEKAAPDILKADQFKRLKQLELQAAVQLTKGLDTFSREDVQGALTLTEKQKKDVDEARSKIEKDAQALFKDAEGDRDRMRDAFKKVMARQKDAVNRVVESLSDEQKKAWKDLTGDPFEFSPPGSQPPHAGQ